MPNDSIPTHHRRASRASFTASSRDIGCQRARRAAPTTPMRPTERESDSYNSSAGATSTLLAQFGALPRRKRQTAEKNAPTYRRVPNPQARPRPGHHPQVRWQATRLWPLSVWALFRPDAPVAVTNGALTSGQWKGSAMFAYSTAIVLADVSIPQPDPSKLPGGDA
jgi:hypothetical protein